MGKLRALLFALLLLTTAAWAEDGPITLDHGKLSTDAGTLTVPVGSTWLRKDSQGMACYAGKDRYREQIVYLMLIAPKISAPLDQKFAIDFAGGYATGQQFSSANVAANVTDTATSFEFPVTGKGTAYGWARHVAGGIVVFICQNGTRADLVGLVDNYQAPGENQDRPAIQSTPQPESDKTPLEKPDHKAFLVIDLVAAGADFLIFVGVAILGLIIRYAGQGQFNPVSIACYITWLVYGTEMFGLALFANLKPADAFSMGERIGFLLGGLTLIVAVPLAMVHLASFVIYRAVLKRKT